MSMVHQTIRTVFCVIVSGKIIKTNTRQCYEIKIKEAELIEKTQSMMKSFKPKSVDTCIPLCSSK